MEFNFKAFLNSENKFINQLVCTAQTTNLLLSPEL